MTVIKSARAGLRVIGGISVTRRRCRQTARSCYQQRRHLDLMGIPIRDVHIAGLRKANELSLKANSVDDVVFYELKRY